MMLMKLRSPASEQACHISLPCLMCHVVSCSVVSILVPSATA